MNWCSQVMGGRPRGLFRSSADGRHENAAGGGQDNLKLEWNTTRADRPSRTGTQYSTEKFSDNLPRYPPDDRH